MVPDKIANHPDGKHVIQFNEKQHTYRDNKGSRYVSGTTFVGSFFPKFDAVSVSEKCSRGNNPKYAGRTPEDIRAEWAAEGERGSSEGDNAHCYAEGKMSSWPEDKLPKPISERCVKLFNQIERITRWLKNKYKFIEAEKIIFSPDLGLAGMVDLIMLDPRTGEILILDWKTNEELSSKNFFQSAFSPIEYLQDTHINKYTLQLSLYQFLLDREGYFPDAKGFRRALIHLTPDSVLPVKIKDYTFEIKEMIKAA